MPRRPAIARKIKEAWGARGSGLRSRFRRLNLLALAAALFPCAGALHSQGGIITTVVGPGLNGSGVAGDSLSLPTGVAVSGSGAGATIYTADAYNCVVWQTQNGQTSVYAGVPGGCASGSIQPLPTETYLAYPVSLALCNGNLFFATHGIDPSVSSGTPASGLVFEIASNGAFSQVPLPGPETGGDLFPVALACDASGNIYLSAYADLLQDSGQFGQVNELSPNGSGGWSTTTLVADALDLAYPAIAVDPVNGDLYGYEALQAGTGWLGTPLLTLGHIEDLSSSNNVPVAGNPTFDNVSGMTIDASGNIYISQASSPYTYTSYVDEVTSDGTTTTLAGTGTPGYSGDGGPAVDAEVDGVDQLVFDSAGYLYLADSENQRIRRIHSLVPGPSALNLVSGTVPQSSGAQFGSLQGVLDPTTGDFYYVAGANIVNVINAGGSITCAGCERVFASIPVGANNGGSTSTLTMVVDSTRNLVYVSNTADGNLYVIDGNPGAARSYTVVGSVALGNAGASLLAIDTALNEIYATGPSSASVTAVQGGTAPALIGNTSGLYMPESISVDTASHAVYVMGVLFEGYGGDYPQLYTLANPASGGPLSLSSTQIGAVGQALPTVGFLTNSIASDPQSGSVLVSGGGYYNATVDEYIAFDIFTFSPGMSEAPLPYPWQPFTTSLDAPNRVFYLTDFDGNTADSSSHAVMVTGMDSVSDGDNTLASTTIPVFGGTVSAPQTQPTPHVFDIEPDTSSYQAWISGSDANDGGFVKLWDSSSQEVTLSATIPSSGGGHLFIDSADHSAYLLDHVNGDLWLINKPPWTPTPAPTFAQPPGSQSVSIVATNPGDLIFYTLDGTPPDLSQTTISCASPCAVNLAQGVFTVIDALELNSTGMASNVALGVFTAPVPTSLVISSLLPNPAVTGQSIMATATLTTAASTVTGTVTFSATLNGGGAGTACSGVSLVDNSGSWQATCSFTESTAGSYSISASFTGDQLNGSSNSSNNVTLQVNQSTIPAPGMVTGGGNALAINANQSGLPWNAVLNNDSSVDLVQNGAILAGESCPAFSSLSTSGLLAGAVFVDGTNSIVYLAMVSGGELYAAYDSINAQGNCAQGPLVQVSLSANEGVEMSADIAQGNVYILNYSGASVDSLYVLPAQWPASLAAPAPFTMDYSVEYGPIVIDPSTHQVFVNDLGYSADGSTPGTFATSGFFVYDPAYKGSAPNPEHVVGYMTTSGGAATAFNVGTLFDNGAGTLILVNENPTAYSATYSGSTPPVAPVTVLNTTASGFSFFTNTTNPNNFNNDVDITAGTTALVDIPAVAQYYAISGADINVPATLVYAFAFNPSNPAAPGELIEYNYSTLQETSPALSSSVAMAGPNGEMGPWAELNYDPESTEIALSESAYGSGALGITTPLCAGSPSLTTVIGNGSTPTPLDFPVVNAVTGYLYAIQPALTYPPPAVPEQLDYFAPPASPCSTSQPTPAAIVAVSGSNQSTVIGQAFASPLVVQVTDAGGNPVSGATVTFTAPVSVANAILSAATATTGSDGTASVTATANGSAGATAYTISATVSGVTAPATFSLTNTQASTTLTVTASSYSLTYGQPVAIDAAISPPNIDGTTPSGSVTFSDGSTMLTPNQPVSAAAASYPVTVPAVGSHTYAAQYSGDGNFQQSAITPAQNPVLVSKANSALAGPATQPVTVPNGQAGSIAVTVTGQFSGNGIATPSGSVTYSVSGNAFASGTAAISAGAATIPVPAGTAAGSYTVTVNYAGDANYNAAAAVTIQLTVESAASTVTQFAFQILPPATLTAGGNAGTIVVVEENSQGAIVTSASDKVQLSVSFAPAPFSSSNEYSAQYLVTASGGIATFNLTSDQLTAAGTYTYTAAIPNPGITYATATETVAAAAPATLKVFFGNNQSVPIGESFQSALSVNVFDQYGNLTPGAVISFTDPATGGPSAVLSSPTAVVSASTSAASVNATADGYAGTYTVTASAAGVPGNPSASFTLTNTKAMTQFAFAIAPQTPIVYGQQQSTLTATFTGAGGTIPTGTVAFSSFSIAIGSVAVNQSGVAQEEVYLTPIENSITAVYPGDSNYGSMSQSTTVHFVSPATPTLSGPATQPVVALAGIAATVPVQVTAPYSGPGITPPSGSVSYTLTQTGSSTPPQILTAPLNSSSAATIPISTTLSPGPWNLNVTYSGDMNYSIGASIVIPIDVADFSLSTSSGAISNVVAYPGQTVSWTFTIAPVAPATTFPVTINLSVSGLPSGATSTITPATIQAGSGATAVTLSVTLPAAEQARNQQSPAVPAYAVLALLLLPFARRMRRAAGRMKRVCLLLAIAAAACAVSAGLNGCGGHSSSQQPQNYTITVTGTAGSLSHSLELGLTVE